MRSVLWEGKLGGGGRVGSRSGLLNPMSSLELSCAALEPTLPGDLG